MAPELFQDGGIHSFTSDFWALGCVLYECYTGRPPFVDKEFTQLAKLILLEAPPNLPGTPTRMFVNLINSLLVKDPAKRIQWAELRNHAFWRTNIVPLAIPPQPAFTNMIESSSEPRLTERKGDRPLRNKTTPNACEKDSKAPNKQDENIGGGVRGEETLVKGVYNGRKTQTKPSSRIKDVKHRDTSKTQRIKDVSGHALDFDAKKTSSDLSDVLWHPSDLSVRPVMPSRKFEKGSDVVPSLPFHTFAPSDIAKLPKDKLDLLYNRITSVMNGNINADKQNVIRYLELLSSNADAATLLTNGPIMVVVIKMLRQSKALALRVQLSSLIGLLIRHFTFIGDDLANSGILDALTDGLRDRQEKVRRFSMAALGELIFYIYTITNTPLETPSNDSRPSIWQVPSALISLISSVLRKGEDDLTQLYALRTIEIISGHGGYWATRFTIQDVINNLCYIFKAPGKQESMRLTAGSCLVRLVSFKPSILQVVIDKLPLKDITSSLFKGNRREQQICLNLLNLVLHGTHLLSRHLLPVIEDKNLFPNLLSLLEQESEVLRGKTILFVALLCKNWKRCLSIVFGNARFLSAMDRLAKDKDKYVQQCLTAFIHTVLGLLETGDIHERRHGLIRLLANLLNMAESVSENPTAVTSLSTRS